MYKYKVTAMDMRAIKSGSVPEIWRSIIHMSNQLCFGVGNWEIVENDKYQKSGTRKQNVVDTQRKFILAKFGIFF